MDVELLNNVRLHGKSPSHAQSQWKEFQAPGQVHSLELLPLHFLNELDHVFALPLHDRNQCPIRDWRIGSEKHCVTVSHERKCSK